MENPKKKYVKRLLSTLQTTANKILFDFLNNREYNCNERAAGKRNFGLPAARFYVLEVGEAISFPREVADSRMISSVDKRRFLAFVLELWSKSIKISLAV